MDTSKNETPVQETEEVDAKMDEAIKALDKSDDEQVPVFTQDDEDLDAILAEYTKTQET